jgi:hypothetical protein
MTRYSALLALGVVAIPVVAQEPVELQPYLGMKAQFEISLPAGWSVLDQGMVLTGKSSRTGLPIVFSAELIDGKAMMSGNKEMVLKVADQLADVEVGRIPGFVVERLPAKKGMSCSGFDSEAQKAVLSLLGRDQMFGLGRTIREKPHADQLVSGGCQGLRVRGKGAARTGDGKILDVFVVSDGEVVFFFKLLNLHEHYPKNVGTFERIVSTVKLNAAPKSGK